MTVKKIKNFDKIPKISVEVPPIVLIVFSIKDQAVRKVMAF